MRTVKKGQKGINTDTQLGPNTQLAHSVLLRKYAEAAKQL